MAKMRWSQYVGALGEAEVVQALLHTGAAVNGLTAADSGWDIHLHLPEPPQSLQAIEAANAGNHEWSLSGRAAHVQVKRSSVPGSWPKVKVGTARGWVTGSRSGTPTFLLVGSPTQQDMTPGWRFVTPHGIQTWLLDRRDASGDHESAAAMESHAFESVWFGWPLHMWSRFAHVLMTVPHLDGLLWQRRCYQADEIEAIARNIAVPLLAGYLSDVRAVRGVEDGGWWDRPGTNALAADLLNSLIGGFAPDGRSDLWSDDLFAGVHEDLFNLADKADAGWSGHGIPTATYSVDDIGGGGGPKAALGSLIGAIREAREAVLAYVPLMVREIRHPMSRLPSPPE